VIKPVLLWMDEFVKTEIVMGIFLSLLPLSKELVQDVEASW
jgi:hypothetical protein